MYANLSVNESTRDGEGLTAAVKKTRAAVNIMTEPINLNFNFFQGASKKRDVSPKKLSAQIIKQQEKDIQHLKAVSGGAHLPRFYPILKQQLVDHGDTICKDMNAIVGYHITDINGDKGRETMIFVDAKNKIGDHNGIIMMKDSLDKMPSAYKDMIM